MRGSITRRGKTSWRLRFDVAPTTPGRRERRYVTVRGSRQDAERELARLVGAIYDNTLIEPSRVTVEDQLQGWFSGHHGLGGKTVERYEQLAKYQILPYLSAIPLQKLRPAHITEWHGKLLKTAGANGRPLSTRTISHAHHVLQRALEHAVAGEILTRNVASIVRPPRVETKEAQALSAEQIETVLAALAGHEFEPLVILALASGARRGELLALRWSDTSLSAGTIRIERSLEQTAGGLKFKRPKTRTGIRTISLSTAAVEALQAHRRKQLEQRLALGLGKAGPDALVFTNLEGNPIRPDSLSRRWGDLVRSLKLPPVSFHALRHSHASALILAKIDPLTVSRRLGHSRPSVTLDIYSHLVANTDSEAADVMQQILKGGGSPRR